MRKLLVAAISLSLTLPVFGDNDKKKIKVKIVNTPVPVTGNVDVTGSSVTIDNTDPISVTGNLDITGTDVDVTGSSVTVDNTELDPVPVKVLPNARQHYFRQDVLEISPGVTNGSLLFPIPTGRVLVIESIAITATHPAGTLPWQYDIAVPLGNTSCRYPLNLPTTQGGESPLAGGNTVWQSSQNVRLFIDPASSFTNLRVFYGRMPTLSEAAQAIVVVQGYTLPPESVVFPANCLNN